MTTAKHDQSTFSVGLEDEWLHRFFQIAQFIQSQGIELPHDWALKYRDHSWMRTIGWHIVAAAERAAAEETRNAA